ncbi:hypothetical protein ACFV03_16925 [Streptomyces mirabilis]
MAADHHDKVAARVWMLCPRHIELSPVSSAYRVGGRTYPAAR